MIEIKDIYDKIDLIREDKLFNNFIGNDSELADEIMIWYENIVKDLKDVN